MVRIWDFWSEQGVFEVASLPKDCLVGFSERSLV